MLQLIKKTKYIYTLELLSGLHIGMGNERMEIGGVDSLVVRRKVASASEVNGRIPGANEPYIPGSSLKGKIRGLLQQSKGQDKMDSGSVADVFGKPADNKDVDYYRSRITFRDAYIDQMGIDRLEAAKQYLDLPMTEVKYETAISPITGKAKTGSLRQTERVPAGVTFTVEVIVDEHKRAQNETNTSTDPATMLSDGIDLLNNDALGKSGSRGYGHVKLTLIKSEVVFEAKTAAE